MSRLLFKDVMALDGSMERARRVDLTVSEGIIEAISEPGSLTGDEVIDCRGKKALLPGFVNCHTHAAMVLLRGLGEERPLKQWLEESIWPVEANLNPERVYWGTKSALLEMASTGTVCFGDMYFEMDQVARAAKEGGMKCGLCRGLIGDDPIRLNQGLELADTFKDDADVTVQLGPHAPYTVPIEALKAISHVACERGLSVHFHYLEAEWERGYIQDQFGLSTMDYLDRSGLLSVPELILAHGVWIPKEDISELASKDVTVVHNPGSNLKLGSGIAPIREMMDSGLSVALGTDGAASNNRLDMWDEMRSTALIHKGVLKDPTVVTARQVIESATYSGYRALGFANSGRIAQGWSADLAFIDLDSPNYIGVDEDNLGMFLVYAGSSKDVEGTMSNGRWIYRSGEFSGLDVDDIVAKAAISRADMVRR
ncbi:amidohydrolase [Dethiosulfovibrio salsuginis]|uniref:5-methylthioadenosine/S-adenosylhomocysteine deaminase n=1 Tax=Dethiosulfovibrio salsuginis TaxID=561720 RepID=A0A1X7I2B9_9BACT|nr:amidohydrolase [Dethiosulfovibrio salsuginis]SMG08336.1 5-methylthioadenosine/S-adenosylhomocysteine deaminase [Dethiosulfovibrio salsuginis]